MKKEYKIEQEDIEEAYNEVKEEWFPTIGQLAVDKVLSHFNKREELEVEEIQDEVETVLMDINPIVARAYIRYRYSHQKEREKEAKIIKLMKEKFEAMNIVNSNANVDEASFSGREKEAAKEEGKK